MVEMTSRERIIRALNHQETDRIPIDIGGIYNLTTMHRDAYATLQQHLGYNDPIVLSSTLSQCVEPSERIRRRFKADCLPFAISAPYGYELAPTIEADGASSFTDNWGVRWRCPKDGYFYDPVGHPLEEATLEDLEKYPWPDPMDRSRIDGLRLPQRIRDAYENTDYAIVLGGPLFNGIYVAAWWLIGMEDFFIAMVNDHELVEALMNKVVEYHIGQWGMLSGRSRQVRPGLRHVRRPRCPDRAHVQPGSVS